MIERLIAWCVKHRLVVVLAMLAIVGWGAYAVTRTPVDAIPDLSDNQVIVFTAWPGRSPQVIEDQVTYPLETSLQDLPGVTAVRGTSNFGYSMVNVIFRGAIDPYWARSRVLERLSTIGSQLPAGVAPTLGPDGTGVGQVFWYVLRGPGYDLARLRSIQDWYLRLGLQGVPGVAEIASVGGFVREYEIDLDPIKLWSYGVSVDEVARAVRRSNDEVGGGLIQRGSTEYDLVGRGYVRSLADLRKIVLKDGPGGVPVRIADVATVQLGAQERRGALDWDGKGEAVGGVVVMRYGQNPEQVIAAVKARLAELSKGLPPGVSVVPAYDRTALIDRTEDTLRHTLIEEAIVVSLVIAIFMLHLGSILVVVLTIPMAVLAAFIGMQLLGIGSNVMSLAGVAIAIGVLVDAAIVMVENALRRLAEAPPGESPTATIVASAQQVGPAIFSSLLIIVLSFLPVFMLGGQGGKLFHPLAATKTFAMAAAALLSVTVVPVLMAMFMRHGRIRSEGVNPVNRLFSALYRPVLGTALRFPRTTVAIALAAMLLAIPIARSIGSEFMPPLDEGSLLYMPTTLPDIGITEANRLMQVEDRILMGFPEVASVLGKVGRAETATDPAPISMVETIVNLKPHREWPAGETKDELISKLDTALQLPGVVNGWTQPIINRINMLSTGIRTDLGLKIFGPDLATLQKLAVQAADLLERVPGAADVYADREMAGRFLDITPDRTALGRYGLTVGDLQQVIDVALGGDDLTRTVEGRERYPVRVRYARDFRESPATIRQILVPTPTGAEMPLGTVASVETTSGPTMIQSENGMLRGLVSLDVRGRDLGSFMRDARRTLDRRLVLPPGYYMTWTGQYEREQQAERTLRVVVPLSLAVILLVLYFTFRSWLYAFLVVLSVPFALIGGLVLQKLLGYPFSVAVWVGYLALAGIATETGVVMLLYLEEAMDRHLARGEGDLVAIRTATMEGALLRLRPKLMTVAAAMIGLLPIMGSTGTGSDVMRPIATPMIGGLLTSSVLVLVVIPVLFMGIKRWQLAHGGLSPSGLGHGERIAGYNPTGGGR